MLHIVDKSTNKDTLQSLDLDDIFRYNGMLYMKVSSVYDDHTVNSYNLDSSKLESLCSYYEVEYIPSELILHERNWDLNN